MQHRLSAAILIVTLGLVIPAIAEEDQPFQFKAFVDTYYAWDFQQPQTRLRGYTTQPLYHNTFGVNLALLEVRYQTEQWRAQLGLQTGSYVTSNLAAEPPLLQPLYAANVGIRLGELWLDGGVMPSHIGFEGILSADNWTYTRSLMADYSPYYETGLKLSGQWDQIQAALLVLNGWQNIAETNNNKALGTQIQYRPVEPLLVNWSTFWGNESPTDDPSALRFFNNFYAQYQVMEGLDTALMCDIGLQGRAQKSASSWWGLAWLVRWQMTPDMALAGRLEHYSDPEQVMVITQTPRGFQVTGASINLDTQLGQHVLWRNEGRVLFSQDAIYPSQGEALSPINALFASSLSVRF